MFRLSLNDIKNVFISVINGTKTFEDASDWASEMIKKDELEQLEFEAKDVQKIFSGLTYLCGIDITERNGEYLHSIENIKDEFIFLFE